MCGISGVYEYKQQRQVDGAVLRAMLDIIQHRGPDDEGVHLEPAIGLGNRRLSIIDVAGGKQPMYNEDDHLVIVFNGEIYNYPDLAPQLLQRGHRLKTHSDTEAILHLYEDHGVECVQQLRGMFAFALWDKREQRLLVARDRLGIKPLYYAVIDDTLVFGSEIKSILLHPLVQSRLDQAALSNFLSLKYIPAPQTLFEGIYALPPGWLLTCDAAGVKTRSYWELSYAPNARYQQTEEECAEELEALLKESVKIHLMSDVPFGAFLSGGIDSSTVVALMSGFLNEPVKTFAVGFEGPGAEMSELPYARLVAQKYQTDHHEVIMRPGHVVDLAEKIVWHLDQPVADEAALPNYMVAELASHHVKMVLTGEGGDELFAGYARYAGERFAPVFRPWPQAARELALDLSRHLPGLRRPKLALYALCQRDEATRLVNWFALFNDEVKAALIADELRVAFNGSGAARAFAAQLQQTDATDWLNRMLYVDTKLWLPDDLLARGDKTSMAASIEGRVPLLDHKLVEFAASLPPRWKLHGMDRKYLLKKVARKWLPAEIIERKKKGFPVPVSVWFRNEARPFVRDLLTPDVLRRRGLFKPAAVAKLLDEHESGFADHGSQIWALMNLELWQRLFIDAPVRVPEALHGMRAASLFE